MIKFNFRRDKDKGFKHIAHGLIPAASIAPRAAVPRTPPPQSPDSSPERHRSALAAAILSSSLTGQTWAIPPARPRSFSETDRSESFVSEPNFSTALYTRDRWSDDLASRPRLSSPEHSEGELEDGEEEADNQEDAEGHIYQTLDRQEDIRESETANDPPLEATSSTPLGAQMSGRRVPSPDLTEDSNGQYPEATQRRESLRRSPDNQKDVIRSLPPIPTTHRPGSAKKPQTPIHSSSEANKLYTELRKQKKSKSADQEKLLEKRVQRLERELEQSQAPSFTGSSAGSQAELQTLRRHAQELVDENDALKQTVHRLNVELSRYQARFMPLSKEELDMKYSAYEDNVKDLQAQLQATKEEVSELRAKAGEVTKENERLHNDINKMDAVNQKDCQQIQQQALQVLKENQVLMDQLEAQHEKAKAHNIKHKSEVSKLSKQLMMLEDEKERLQEELEESRWDLQKQKKEVHLQRAGLKDAVTWDEHCSITGKLRRKAERKMSALRRQKEEHLLKEEKTRHYLEAVISVAEHISRERDHLLHMACGLQQEKQGFVGRLLNGTVRFGQLQEELKVYRRQASTRLAVLEEAAEGRTASYQREIVHLQKLLRERQEAEEKLLQSKREVEEELEVVWQAATRENQQMRETLLDTKVNIGLDPFCYPAS
ncbi:centrosomal protein of 89 kDa isoform X3 [Cyprinodon tularosa]|uniref:centrosomal protein of 89 kDa isoform X3 n=1 Tax=Cyprinodon tularosa TaxID=77115 RepID=UPI0018E279BC|nr:centrosomal protein of 89 kDa isoform X3 [Cyprinodon tularosa]